MNLKIKINKLHLIKQLLQVFCVIALAGALFGCGDGGNSGNEFKGYPNFKSKIEGPNNNFSGGSVKVKDRGRAFHCKKEGTKNKCCYYDKVAKTCNCYSCDAIYTSEVELRQHCAIDKQEQSACLSFADEPIEDISLNFDHSSSWFGGAGSSSSNTNTESGVREQSYKYNREAKYNFERVGVKNCEFIKDKLLGYLDFLGKQDGYTEEALVKYQIEEGLDVNLSVMWLYSKWLTQQQDPPNKYNEAWFKTTIDSICKLDTSDKLDAETSGNIEEFIFLIRVFNHYDVKPDGSGRVLSLITPEESDTTILSMLNEVYRHKCSVLGYSGDIRNIINSEQNFTKKNNSKNLTTLRQIKWLPINKTKQEITSSISEVLEKLAPGALVYIRYQDRRAAIYREGSSYQYYNPGYDSVASEDVKELTLDEISSIIINDMPDPNSIEIYLWENTATSQSNSAYFEYLSE